MISPTHCSIFLTSQRVLLTVCVMNIVAINVSVFYTSLSLNSRRLSLKCLISLGVTPTPKVRGENLKGEGIYLNGVY